MKYSKIAILGLHDDPNLGDPIISDCTEYLIRRYAGTCEITKLSLNDVEAYMNQTVRRILSLIGRVFSKLHIPGFGFLKHSITSWNIQKHLSKSLHHVDLLVIGGGGVIKFKYQYFGTMIHAATRYAEHHGIPIYYNSVGVEGFDSSNRGCRVLMRCLNSSNVFSVSTRDDVETLVQYYLAPENRSKACLVCDPAVWASEAYNIRAKKSNIIGINISHERLFYNYGIDLDPKNYFKLMIEVIDYLRINYEIELYTNGSEPDNKMAHKIQNYYKTKDHNIRLIIPTTGPELVETISRYKAILATRLHSYIVAYSLNVPAVGMVWNRKVAFFGRNIQSDYMVESENFNKDYLVAMIKGAIKNGYNQHVRYEFRNSIIKAIKQFSGTKKSLI